MDNHWLLGGFPLEWNEPAYVWRPATRIGPSRFYRRRPPRSIGGK